MLWRDDSDPGFGHLYLHITGSDSSRQKNAPAVTARPGGPDKGGTNAGDTTTGGTPAPGSTIRDILNARGTAFLEYWLSLRDGRLMPDRTDFDPAAVKPLLPHIVIQELITPELIRLRLAGTAVVQDYGREITGLNYLDFVEPERRKKASEALFLMWSHPVGMSVFLKSFGDKGSFMIRHIIGLPLGDRQRGRKLLYFCSTRDRFEIPPDTPDPLVVHGIKDRRFFDIGAGIPPFID